MRAPMRQPLLSGILLLALARCACAPQTCPAVPCDPGLHCTAQGTCVEQAFGSQCKLDQDCGSGLICRGGVCAACAASTDCREVPGEPYCDQATFRCVACLSARDCD